MVDSAMARSHIDIARTIEVVIDSRHGIETLRTSWTIDDLEKNGFLDRCRDALLCRNVVGSVESSGACGHVFKGNAMGCNITKLNLRTKTGDIPKSSKNAKDSRLSTLTIMMMMVKRITPMVGDEHESLIGTVSWRTY